MCGLAHYFESEDLSTVLVGFVREHIEAMRPPRSLFLDFPMGRGMGKPNNPEFQKKVIRAAFALFGFSLDLHKITSVNAASLGLDLAYPWQHERHGCNLGVVLNWLGLPMTI